jgi:mono/diheme cytochrome c family protein/glucose/arabinose dehydrogenase
MPRTEYCPAEAGRYKKTERAKNMSSRWAITVATVAILATGVVPQGQQQPTTTPPAQPPTTAPQTPAPAAPNQPGRGGRGGLDAEIAAGADFSTKPPVTRLSAEGEQKHFLLPPGFKIEPVLTDPLIEDPVGVTFDANGRMYVLEMRSYMRDADGINSREPISRISRHEDTNGDGTFDKHTVFADKLIMPRMAFPLQDGVILTLETDNRDMSKLTDTDGDGVADKREVFYQNVGRVTNMEWQPGGLTWALDNWLYMTYNPFRLRLMPDGKILREETDANGGQWWSAQDNYGKMWWVDGGGEIGPVNFQTPIAYGAFNVADNFEPDFQVPWPAAPGIADMQGGMRRVRMPDGTLNHFTAASGVQIYRGHRLPQDMIGDLFFTEPVGRIVRRAKVVVTDGLTQLRNAYPKSEFIRSTDPLFRPVCITNAPDGTLYLMDMYTGIIQDSQFVGPYLRGKATQYGLDKQHNWGRIWRITYEGTTPDRQRPQMYTETAAQLVKHLEHANGWWRDTAQEQLVLRQDKSVVPALQTMARSSSNQLARIHALWTLEGLGALDATLVREQMKDKDPKIRIQAIRASETLYKSGDKTFADDYRAMLKDADTEVVIQAMLTLNLQKVPQYAELIRSTSETASARGIKEIGSQILRPRTGSQGQPASLADNAVNGLNFSVDDRRVLRRGDATYKELCISCHGPEGQGAPMAGAPAGSTLAPPLTKSPRVTGYRDNVIKILLNGLSGDVDGKSYPGGVMPPMGTNTDEWVADIASYVRNNFGNSESLIRPEHVAAVRAANTRKEPWTIEDLAKTTPTLLTNYSEWKATASHNSEAAANGLNGTGTARWESGVPQEPGMWFQIELPRAVTVAEILVDTVVGGRGGFNFGRGGRGGNTVPALGFGGYRVQVSTDGTTWSEPVAEASGLNPINPTTVIALKPVQARFIRITQTATPGNQFQFGWGIQRVRIFGM